ncbi:multiheme c-type cytochrome [Pirellulaceae bacterium SH449]
MNGVVKQNRFLLMALFAIHAWTGMMCVNSHAQVVGICTAPDGNAWMEPPPDDYLAPKASLIPQLGPRPSPTKNDNISQLKRWLDKDPSLAESAPVPSNRYADQRRNHLASGTHTGFRMHSVGHSSIRLDEDAEDLLGSPTAEDLLVPGVGTFHGSDPLGGMGPDAARETERLKKQQDAPPQTPLGIDPHWEVYTNDRYPSAMKCAKCHQKIYDEWRVSSHAYSAVSPMFNRFEQKVHELVRGTSGTFCMRCHAPIATQADYPRDASILEAPIVFREGITCIVCHRVVERYGRVNGERRIEPGSEYDPVVGNLGGQGVDQVLADKDNFKVKIDPRDKRPLQPMHQGAIQFEQLNDSSFCAGCHQVVVQPGIALEIVYQQYRQGPACKKGISCQDCHMGVVPGKPLGYEYGAAAVVNDKPVRTDRKHSNHIFWGPAVPLAHPGIFPHNEKSLRWAAKDWLQFDHRQGWGTEEFEQAVSSGRVRVNFPPAWKSPQERRDARKVVDENQKLIGVKRASAIQVLENGSRIDGPFFASTPTAGRDLKLSYVVSNTSEGHNMPSGSLGAQPQLWLNVVLIGPDGQHLWESGHLDSNGDMCDIHSLDVRAGKVQRDAQLVNFQTKFLITNLKGTEREMYLPVNVDIDPLPFFRPGAVPYTVLNHPPFIRMEAHSIPPMDSRTARYTIPANLMRQKGRYRLSVRLRSRVEPPYFLLFCDGTPEMLTSLNEAILDAHPYSTEFVVR